MKWNFFAQDTVGKQLVKAADSIAANLSEGYGSYHYNESKHSSYYSGSSLYETRTWLTKAFNRKLVSEKDFHEFILTIDFTGIKLNNYINSIGKPSKQRIPAINDNE